MKLFFLLATGVLGPFDNRAIVAFQHLTQQPDDHDEGYQANKQLHPRNYPEANSARQDFAIGAIG